MTVAELVAELQAMPQDHIVVMSSDGEGNDYSPLDDTEQGYYMPRSSWSGSMAHEADGLPENCVILWPTN